MRRNVWDKTPQIYRPFLICVTKFGRGLLFTWNMNGAEKYLQVARALRDSAKNPGPLSKRARMIILAERLEEIAGRDAQPQSSHDLAELALSAYGRRLSAGRGISA
jgi:hypothetical protein